MTESKPKSEAPKVDITAEYVAAAVRPLSVQDEAYFVAIEGLFTLSRLSELGYGSTDSLFQYIKEDHLPARKFWGRYWLSLAEACAAAGKDQGDVDDDVAGSLVQLDCALEGLTRIQRARIASLLGGEPR